MELDEAIAEETLLKTNRPVLQLPLSSRELFLEIAAIAGMLTCILMLLPVWKSIPQTIPSHMDLSGKVDAMGSKSGLLIIPGITLFLYLLLTILSRFPHTFNYPFPVTMDNAERLYRIGREMMSWLKTIDIWLVTILNWIILQVARGHSSGAGSAMTIVVGVLVVSQTAMLAIGVYAMYRAK
jgi:hypothetical protein